MPRFHVEDRSPLNMILEFVCPFDGNVHAVAARQEQQFIELAGKTRPVPRIAKILWPAHGRGCAGLVCGSSITVPAPAVHLVLERPVLTKARPLARIVRLPGISIRLSARQASCDRRFGKAALTGSINTCLASWLGLRPPFERLFHQFD